ncbi:DnaJ domain [Lasallia pustulata]|uniref:DnaJ domain n=1 Tax=Lasallia pustulata TaxID=136370 RepID=A0A1W5CRQ4_9LECA|nr:DnaJ domain [Lasallia pustulata]
MKTALFTIALWSCLLAVAVAWSKEDHEIFRLRDEVQATEGEDVTFYDFLGVGPGASQDEINRAFRKKSRLIHPDKVKQSFVASKPKPTAKPKPGKKSTAPGVHVTKGPSQHEIRDEVKKASDRFARLGIVANILRGPGRERYDHFLQNGFPRWRGTGYYYARFRPGLGSVLIGLFVLGGGLAHYGAMYLSWKRQREFVERYIRYARRAAWGDELGIKGIPGIDGSISAPPPAATTATEDGGYALNRRQKRMQERESKKDKDGKKTRGGRRSGTSTPMEATAPAEGPQGEKKRVQAENGKTLIVDSVGNVFLEEENPDGEKEEYLLDPNEIMKPTFRQTMLFRLPVWVYVTLKGRVLGRSKGIDEAESDANDDSSSSEESESATFAAKPASNGPAQRRGKRKSRAN